MVVVGWFFIKGPDEHRGEVVLARFGKSTLSSFPVQVFAYTYVLLSLPIEIPADAKQAVHRMSVWFSLVYPRGLLAHVE
jgi:hypothetical protein